MFIKIKLKCFLHFNGSNHVSIIGTEVPYSSREKLLKTAKDRISSLFFFFPKSKNREQTLLIKPHVGSTDRTRHSSHSPAIKRSFHYQSKQTSNNQRETRPELHPYVGARTLAKVLQVLPQSQAALKSTTEGLPFAPTTPEIISSLDIRAVLFIFFSGPSSLAQYELETKAN